MSRLEIVRYPDPRLSIPARPVEVFDAALAELVANLLETMRAAPGVGITASHCGIALRVTVIELDRSAPPLVLINPVILSVSDERSRFAEGSVSMPGATEEVERPATCRISYRTVEGIEQHLTVDGFLSTCIQHEIDQMDGIFWLQRLSRLKRERVVARWRKQSR